MARKKATAQKSNEPAAKLPRGSLLVRLTPEERGSLVQFRRLRAPTRKRIEAGGDEAVRLTKNEVNEIIREIGWKLEFDPPASPQSLLVLRDRVVDALEQTAPDAFGGEHLRGRDKKVLRTDLYFQFRIELLDVEPAVWRRILMPDGTLADLHTCLQAAFGWEDYHLHEFVIGGLRFGPRPPELMADLMDFVGNLEDESGALVSQLVPQSGKQACWMYTYDFGDGWCHEIVFEGCAPKEPRVKYPQCVDGARACPPEDIGGPWGYVEFLEAIRDPSDERHAELMEWVGPFDPESFDAKRSTAQMRKWLR